MTGPRRRRAPANLRPDEVRLARSDVREGLDWLGRPPEIRAGPIYRLARRLLRLAFTVLLGFRTTATGREHLPAGGGYLPLAAVHRGWMDPFPALDAVPVDSRVWILGSGPSSFDRPWKERLLRVVGGVLPVWRGGIGIDVHATRRAGRPAARGGRVHVRGGCDRAAHRTDRRRSGQAPSSSRCARERRSSRSPSSGRTACTAGSGLPRGCCRR